MCAFVNFARVFISKIISFEFHGVDSIVVYVFNVLVVAMVHRFYAYAMHLVMPLLFLKFDGSKITTCCFAFRLSWNPLVQGLTWPN